MDALAEAVYGQLLSAPEADLGDIASAVGATEDQVRGAFDTLAELALLRPAADSGQLRAVRPTAGLEALLARQQADVAAHVQRLEASRAAAASLIAMYSQHASNSAVLEVERVEGVDAIRERLAELASEARTEVQTFAPGGGHSTSSVAAARPLDTQLLERGVQLRIVYLDSIRRHPPTMGYAREVVALGGQVRTAPALPVRMTVVDRRTAIVASLADSGSISGVMYSMPGTVAALSALFDHVWESAVPLTESVGRSQDSAGLSPQQRTALEMLVAGHTDEVVAKRLGVSQRTARRIASEAMERLGALSRFQAGYKLAKIGWLDAEPQNSSCEPA